MQGVVVEEMGDVGDDVRVLQLFQHLPHKA
jgi:hypothetical protein